MALIFFLIVVKYVIATSKEVVNVALSEFPHNYKKNHKKIQIFLIWK